MAKTRFLISSGIDSKTTFQLMRDSLPGRSTGSKKYALPPFVERTAITYSVQYLCSRKNLMPSAKTINQPGGYLFVLFVFNIVLFKRWHNPERLIDFERRAICVVFSPLPKTLSRSLGSTRFVFLPRLLCQFVQVLLHFEHRFLLPPILYIFA